jgi:hypothetical protein
MRSEAQHFSAHFWRLYPLCNDHLGSASEVNGVPPLTIRPHN